MTEIQEEKLNAIYEEIIGNPVMKRKGIIDRIESLENYKKKDEKLKQKIAGGAAVGIPLLTFGWNWLVDYFKKL